MGKRWTIEEINYLLDNINDGLINISNKLKKSRKMILNMIKKIKNYFILQKSLSLSRLKKEEEQEGML